MRIWQRRTAVLFLCASVEQIKFCKFCVRFNPSPPQSFGEGRKTLKTVRACRKGPPIGQCVQAHRLDSPPRSFGEGLGVGLKGTQNLQNLVCPTSMPLWLVSFS